MMEQKKGESDKRPHPIRLKYLYSAAILFGNVPFGSSFNFLSPALEDLRIKYETDTDDISKVFTVQLVCYCLGALSSAFIYRILPKQIGVIFCYALMAASLILTPHIPSKALFFVIGGFLGFGIGLYDATQVVWMIEIWQEKAGPWIQMQHFCYALGSNIPPLLLGPFLADEEDEDDDGGKLTTPFYSSTILPEAERESRIYIPFTIGGAIAAAACILQILLFIFYRYYTPPMYVTEQKSEKEIEDEQGSQPTGLKVYVRSMRFKLIVITGIFLGLYQGMEMCTMQFLPTYGQKSALKLSESESAYTQTGLTACFAIGRFIGIFVILKISPVIMLFGNLVLVLIGAVLLTFWSFSNLTMLWVASCLIGLGFSTVYASFSAWIEKHLVVNDNVGAVMIVCGSAVAAIYPLIVGEIINENVRVLAFVIYFSFVGCVLSLNVGVWLAKKRTGPRV